MTIRFLNSYRLEVNGTENCLRVLEVMTNETRTFTADH